MTMATAASIIGLKDVLAARERVAQFVKLTPILTSKEADRQAGKKIYFKSEHLQSTGSFKVRGALNAVLKLKEGAGTSRHPGVVTHSSGNHGQALAWASSLAGLPCTIVVPSGSPACKVDAIRSYGAEVVECFPSPTARVEMMERVSKETGKVFISPYDHPDVIAGQGTIGLELLEQIEDLDTVLVAISGGGLASGIATAVKALRPQCKVYLVTPKGKMMSECLRAGERLWPNPPVFLDTLAEAIKLQQPGFNTFTILNELVEKDVFEMVPITRPSPEFLSLFQLYWASDDEMVKGMKFSFQRMKQVVEAAAGAAVAAAFSDKMKTLSNDIKKVAVVLCGGNTDIENLPWYSSFKQAY